MSYTIEKKEHNMAVLTIEVSADDVDKATEEAFRRNKNKINIPGFRKGKVSRSVVEKMYGKDFFLEQAANNIVQKAYADAYDECEEEIVSAPEIDIVTLVAGQPMVFTATVALKPEVKLGKYKGVEIEKIETEPTEEEIEQVINRERENNARMVSVDDRAVQEKDIAVIDFEGFVGGKSFEGGKGENYELTIGSHSFIDTFEDQLIGKNVGDDVNVEVTFPEEYHAKELAGKPALFKVHINEIKVKELPELDDEFAGEVSEFETLEEYKEDVKKQIRERKEKGAKDQKEMAAIDAVVEDSEMDIPDPYVETVMRQMIQEYSQRLSMQGLNLEQYMQFTGQTREKFEEDMKPQALKRIQSRLVLEEIVKKENITVSDEDLEEEYKKISESYKMDIEEVKDMVGEEGKEEIKKDLSMTKAGEFLAENAKEVKKK
ncbi:MAG TPA: trigger factor [Lachnospiraceae bacterium]|nr:trigger factor [Lachnospiraceae bacterium]